MTIQLTDEQRLLQETVRDLLAAALPIEELKRRADVAHQWDDVRLWTDLSELGLPMLLVPAERGGADLDLRDLAVMAEEFGAACAPDAALVAAIGASLVADAGPAGDAVLRRVAAGERVALALDAGMTVGSGRNGMVASGRARLVSEAVDADILVTAAETADGPVVVAVERSAAGVDVAPAPTLDATRRRADVQLNDAAVEVIATGEAAAAALDRARLAHALATAADSVGAGRAALGIAVDYAKVREQFGTRIGSFQSIKHLLVDTHIALENARAQVRYAAAAAAAETDGRWTDARAAKVLANRAGIIAGGNCIQVLGGIGFTTDLPAHLYLRRARLNEVTAGSTITHLARMGETLEELLRW